MTRSVVTCVWLSSGENLPSSRLLEGSGKLYHSTYYAPGLLGMLRFWWGPALGQTSLSLLCLVRYKSAAAPRTWRWGRRPAPKKGSLVLRWDVERLVCVGSFGSVDGVGGVGRIDMLLPAIWKRTDQRPLVVPTDRTVATSYQDGDTSCQGDYESDQLDSELLAGSRAGRFSTGVVGRDGGRHGSLGR